MSAKNCHTCKHLGYWGASDYGEVSGFTCEKRDPKTLKEESIFLSNLDKESYRSRYKRCFEPGLAANPPTGAGQ